MIYLVGGAPRSGKSILCQQFSARVKAGWVSTDLLAGLLRASRTSNVEQEWNSAPEAITAHAAWFFPYLERFIWGASSMAENYVIEGVGFLPAQVRQLSSQYTVSAVFLGCSSMSLEKFDQFPGRSVGYSFLPDDLRLRIAQDVPRWSKFVRQECERFGCPYVDTAVDFPTRLRDAEAVLAAGRE